MPSIYDIDESKVKIDKLKWSDHESVQLASKTLFVIQRMLNFWQPLIERGQMLWDMYEGDILTEEQRAQYDHEDKIIIEPPILKSPIRALLGQLIKSRKSGRVVTEEIDYNNPEIDANELETINLCMKHLERHTEEQIKVRDAKHDTLVTAYPTVLIYKKRKPTLENNLKVELERIPWNSCCVGPINAADSTMSKITELAYFTLSSKADLIKQYPEREDDILSHWGNSEKVDDKLLSSALNWASEDTIDNIPELRSMLKYSNSLVGNNSGGLIPVYQRFFPVKSKQQVYVMEDFEDEDELYFIPPKDWDKKKLAAWEADNKGKFSEKFTKDVTTLWKTVCTGTGLVLANEPHWYQNNGKLPAQIYVPAVMNGRPTGPTVDMADNARRNCISEIEYLDAMRKGEGQTLAIKEGTLSRPESFAEETNKATGCLLISKDFEGSPAEAVHVIARHASTQWKDYAEFAKNGMYENTRLNETMQGEAAPRQAAIAKEMEVGMAMTVNSIYIDNFNYQDLALQNLKLSLFPHTFDEEMMVVSGETSEDSESQHMAQQLNVPTEFDKNGDPVPGTLLNDVITKRYKFVMSLVDDSVTAKARDIQDSQLILNSLAGPTMQADPTGGMFRAYISSVDNPLLKKAAKKMEESANASQQSQAEIEQKRADKELEIKLMEAKASLIKAKSYGLSYSLASKEVVQNPKLLDALMDMRRDPDEDVDTEELNAEPTQDPMSQGMGQPQPMAPQMMPTGV
jgi:hypothetical protein